MQDPSIHRQNSWVNDLNDSVQEFQRKDKWARILKITFFSVCATILLLSIFIWSSGRLFFVFPEIDSIESISDLKKELDHSNELQEIINNEALSCKIIDIDRYKRLIGECFINQININQKKST